MALGEKHRAQVIFSGVEERPQVLVSLCLLVCIVFVAFLWGQVCAMKSKLAGNRTGGP